MSADVDQSWGPAVERRARRRRWPRALLLLIAALLVIAITFALWLSSQLERTEVGNLAASGGPLHILVAGSDDRAGLTPQERVELRTGNIEGERTDTIFVMSIDGGKVALLAFPRDLWVSRCDGSVGRINSATAIGGPGCLVRTVRDVSGIEINHYLEVSFGGFRDLVDAVGGVQLCLDEPISDRDANIDLSAGCQRLDGADALGYVRVRKIDNDLMRIQRQQEFVQALARQVASVGTLANPLRLAELARGSGQAVRVDQGMGPIDLARIAWGARGLGAGATATHTVPTTPRTTSGGAEVLEARVAEAEELFASFRDGSVFGEISQADTGPDVRPQDVQVTVLNGAGVAGLAGSVGERLRQEGFNVIEIGNAEPTPATVLRHGLGDEAGAQLVAEALPGGAALQEAAGTAGVTVVLGTESGAAG